MIYCIGEAIFDIIFSNGQAIASKAGGSMLNSAVSLGRCGLSVEMITELGNDRIGEMVLEFLHENHVSTSLFCPVTGMKTPVSLAFLDEQGNAHYSFYKQYPENRLNITWPEINDRDFLLFGSFYSIDPAVHDKIVGFISKAKAAGTLILYDPNIRRNHLEEIRNLMPFLEENIALADIVRGSDEDFLNILGLNDGQSVFEKLRHKGCRNLIYTCSEKGAYLFGEQVKMHVAARKVEVVSTIGAGDSFNAGIVFGLAKKRITRERLDTADEAMWKEIIGCGIDFASEVCGSYENYISLSTGMMAHG